MVRSSWLFLVFGLVVHCTKSRQFQVKGVCTESTIYSLPCMSCWILPFLSSPNPHPLIPYRLDLKPSYARIARKASWFFLCRRTLKRGVNRGMQIRRSVVFLGPIRRSDLIFVQIRIRVTLKIFPGI